MNKATVRLIAGVFFTGAGIFGFVTKTGHLQVLSIAMGAYGLFSIGWGVYLLKQD